MNRLQTIVFGLKYFFLPNTQAAALQRYLERQREVLQVMSVLPGQYKYEQIDDALHAAGVQPRAIYESLCADESTVALALFMEALDA